MKMRRVPFSLMVALAAATSFVGSLAVAAVGPQVPELGSLVWSAARSAGCSVVGEIKGNVSYNNGERIYHAPGQRHYEDKVITWERGERRFCTEAEARAAGWRKSGI